MIKVQERELNYLKTKYQGCDISVKEIGTYVVVKVVSKDYSINKEFTINIDGDVYENKITDSGMMLSEKIVLLMVPVYGILFFSLGEAFMIPIFILGVINLFLAAGIIF